MINRVIMPVPVSTQQFGTAGNENRQLVTNITQNLDKVFNPELQPVEKLSALKVAEGLLFRLWNADSNLHNGVVSLQAYKLSKDSENMAAANSFLNGLEGNYHSVRRIIQTASSRLSS